MNKKGMEQEMYFFIFALLLVIGSWFTMQSFVNTTVKGTLFERLYLSRDLGLSLDALHATQGNAFYSYTPRLIDLSKFEIDLDHHQVSVTERGQSIPTSFAYAEDRQQGSLSAKKLRLPYNGKVGVAYADQADLKAYADTLRCPLAHPAFAAGTAKIVVDADAKVGPSYVAMQRFYQSISSPFNQGNAATTRRPNADRDADWKTKAAAADLLISFATVNESRKSHVRVYIDASSPFMAENFALACRIASPLARLSNQSLAIIPADGPMTEYADVFAQNQRAIVIVLGDINDDKAMQTAGGPAGGSAAYLGLIQYMEGAP